MSERVSLAAALEAAQRRTGVVMPVYLPRGGNAECAEALLRDTVAACCAFVADPGTICLSVDGEDCGAAVCQELSREFGVATCAAPVNRGKLQAVNNGMRYLLELGPLDYVAILDDDGDHSPHELPTLLRAAQHIQAEAGERRVLILGCRSSRHRPMGFLRGELEELADRMLLDALVYRAAVSGRPLHLEYATALAEYPDFHSGYKLFSRAAAEDVFLAEPRLMGVSEACYYRHAVEAVMTVEALECGTILGLANRNTLNRQPVTTFGLLDRSQLTADMIIWPCKRLGVPGAFVRQWLANHVPRLLLETLSPQGKAELEAVCKHVLAAFLAGPGDGAAPPRQPLFL